MIVSFDLDDLLIPTTVSFPLESHWWQRLIAKTIGEPLRLGSVELMHDLQRSHRLWVYTTSLRNQFRIWLWFRLLGIQLSGVVNQQRHSQAANIFKVGKRVPSKYPPAFGIDLHVDDSIGVKMESEEHNFKCLQISPNDLSWLKKVETAV